MAHEEQQLPTRAESAPQDGISRRKLIVTGATLAVAGAAAGTGVTLAAQAVHGHSAAAADPKAPVMVHVKDHRSGQLDVFVGTERINVTNKEIANELARIASTVR